MLATTTEGFSLTPRSLDEAMKLADMMARSQMVPKDYQNQPANVLVAVQMGAELGFKPVQALQNIAVVNGRPSVWGDGLRALVMSAPDLAGIKDSFDEAQFKATCVISRQLANGNVVEFVGEFSRQDAENAGLWGRNTWKSYPKKMLEWRAFGFAARKAYADRLRGIQLAEEAQDIPTPERDITPRQEAIERELPAYPDQDFLNNLPKWRKAIAGGMKTADDLIAMIETKGTLTDEQKAQIKEPAAVEE